MKLLGGAFKAVCVVSFLVLDIVLLCTKDVHAQTTVRPYKFGFTIDQQQHRSEMRDERGIVMGEFGFITADGIYHVTVYATDEEGKFRILAMRNYPYESPPKTIDMVVVPKRQPPPASITTTTTVPTTTTTTTTKTLPKFKYNSDACSGCSLPEKTQKATIATQAPIAKTNIRPLSKIIPNNGQGAVGGVAGAISASNNGIDRTTPGGKFGNMAANTPTTFGSPPVSAQKPNLVQQPFKTPSLAVGASSSGFNQNKATGAPAFPAVAQNGATLNKPLTQASKVGAAVSSARGGTGSNGVSGGGSGGIGGSSTKTAAGGAGGGGDLYRFKYTLDYHGHKETGSRNGNKEGSFFAVGDDNVERTIEYIANEYGFQPRIRWRKLEASVPSKENTLKEYEFVWFKDS